VAIDRLIEVAIAACREGPQRVDADRRLSLRLQLKNWSPRRSQFAVHLLVEALGATPTVRTELGLRDVFGRLLILRCR
jgi:hypothetical protein